MRQAILSISLMACLLAACLPLSQLDQTRTCEVDWSKTDPIAFLEMLTRRPNAPCWLSQAPEGWIKKEHVEYLLRQINSPEPAAPVVSLFSSYDPREETSTVGNEAMFLIEGFRKQRYPPGLCSVYHFKGDPDEFRKWWQEQKNDLPHSMKGYELYSWYEESEDQWFYTLVTGTNRLKTIEEFQEGIAGEINQRLLGKPLEVLVEEKHKGKWKGRTRTHKLVFFEDDGDWRGKLANARITWAGPWSMQGKLA